MARDSMSVSSRAARRVSIQLSHPLYVPSRSRTSLARVLGVVKAFESIEAPHAIEDWKRIYIRVASTSDPYDLADLDRIEYLLRRRAAPERQREKLIAQAASRSFYRDHDQPRVRVIVSPVYPRGVLLPHDDLHERAEQFRERGVRHLRDFRLVHEAIASGRTAGGTDHYFELSIYGVIFFEAPAQITSRIADIDVVILRELISPVGSVLNTALGFVKDTLTNVMIRYGLFGWRGIAFRPDQYHPAESYRCIDQDVSVETITVADTLGDQRKQIITQLMQQLLWAFNYRTNDLAARVDQAGKDAHLW
jgi:hypothetical protein